VIPEDSIEKQILDTNPLLEAFGNAKTFKNNNSSRFGKFLLLNFKKQGQIHSANVTNKLLEKSRVVKIHGVERNFHIFYQLICNAKSKAKYGLLTPKDYFLTN